MLRGASVSGVTAQHVKRKKKRCWAVHYLLPGKLLLLDSDLGVQQCDTS